VPEKEEEMTNKTDEQTKKRLEEAEDLVLSAIVQGPDDTMPLIMQDQVPLRMKTAPARALMEIFTHLYKSTNDITVTGVYDSINACKLDQFKKDVLKEKFDRANSKTLHDTPQKVLNYASSIIKAYSIKIAAKAQIEEITKAIDDSSTTAEDISKKIEDLQTTVASSIGRSGTRSMHAIINDLFDGSTKAPLTGVPTGFKTLDRALYGLRPGLTTVIGGTGDGKSTLLANIGKNIAMSGYNVLVINIEVNPQEWALKTMSMLAQVEEEKLITRSYLKDKDEDKRVQAAQKVIEGWQGKYFFEYMPGLQIDAIKYHIINYVSKFGVEVVIFDHVKAKEDEQDRYNALGALTTMFKNLSGMLDIPIVVAAQARRPQSNYRAQLGKADIADSYDIIRNSNAVLGISSLNEEVAPAKSQINAGINFIKNRSGREDVTVDIRWVKTQSFMEQI
jgi:replicative DNA helicase